MEGEDNSPPPLFVPKRIFAVSSEPVGIRVTPYHKPHAIIQILNSLYAEEVNTIRALPFGKLVEIVEMPFFLDGLVDSSSPGSSKSTRNTKNGSY